MDGFTVVPAFPTVAWLKYNLPWTYSSLAKYDVCPIPIPPVTTNAPEVEDVDAVELFIFAVPFTFIFSDIPTPPNTVNAPEEKPVDDVDADTVNADENVFAPAIVCARVVIKPVEAAPA
jgi:hypothetical protein